jgi:hypothetical protein
MEGYCPAHIGRSPLAAPTTEPTNAFFRMGSLELAADQAMGIAIGADGTVYVEHGGANAEVFATDLSSQNPLWLYPTKSGAGPWTPAIGADGTVWMICATNAAQWCGRAPSGAIATVDPGVTDVVRSSVTIAGDGLLRWVDSNKALHALAVGNTGWSPPRNTYAIDGSDPAVTLDGRTIIDDDNGTAFIYDAGGSLIGSIDPMLMVPGNFGSAPVVTSDGSLAWGVISVGKLAILPPLSTTPTILTLPNDVEGIAAASDGTLFVTDINNRLHVIRNGAEVGTTVKGTTAPILAANNVLLVGGNLDLLAYDATQVPPRLLWKHTFDSDVTNVRLGNAGLIVVATVDQQGFGTLQAIKP